MLHVSRHRLTTFVGVGLQDTIDGWTLQGPLYAHIDYNGHYPDFPRGGGILTSIKLFCLLIQSPGLSEQTSEIN